MYVVKRHFEYIRVNGSHSQVGPAQRPVDQVVFCGVRELVYTMLLLQVDWLETVNHVKHDEIADAMG